VGGTGRPLLIVPHMHAYVVDISRWMVRGVRALPVARMMASCVCGCMVVCHGDMVGPPVLYHCMEHVCPCDIVSDVCFRNSARGHEVFSRGGSGAALDELSRNFAARFSQVPILAMMLFEVDSQYDIVAM